MSTAAPLQNTAAKSPLVSKASHAGLLLQRKCACGGPVSSSLSGKCGECNSKRLQKKLSIGANNDPLEQEADRVADQVLAAPAHSTVSGAASSIQRFTGQGTGDAGTAPPSVDRVISGSGRSLDPALQQDMGQRFGHDFSQVRVHTGAAAEQSARDVNAHAYTVGHNIVFGAGRFSPGTHEGQRLIAHELTHVAQQSSNQPTMPGLPMRGTQGNGLEREADNVVRRVLLGSGSAVNRTARIPPALQKKADGDAIELEFVTVDPEEERRLKERGITLPTGIPQTNPEDECPKGYKRIKRATWLRCDESAGTRNSGCALCTPQGEQCKCTDIVKSLGHDRIIAPKGIGKCGDWFKITSPRKGAPIIYAIKAEIAGGDTPLDIHTSLITELGEDLKTGRYDVCLKGPENHDDRFGVCGSSKCPTPKKNPKKKG